MPGSLFAPAPQPFPEGGTRLSVLVVDGDDRRREVLARSLAEAGAGTVHEASSADEARRRAFDGPPCELAVVDLGLPDGGAFALLAELRTDGWRTVAVGPDDHTAAQAAFTAGALAYLTSSSGMCRVVEPDPTVAPLTGSGTRVAAVDGAPRELSQREVQVLQQVADGHSNSEIGSELGLSALTVKSHLSRIGRKLGTGDRAQMVALAMRAGVVR
ncbi:response regulator transcription factor [Actinomycetospora termitidis]|uniref:Response regulator transcription factor n=1 Tax=Actinomycetospora termitidis TaxID=3053470 RepID=A0ABT7MH77_9PSEU|nr:response regulator transcription factor [Actinomycetospora sp. Odt1-22]MDL5160043.1 response regulator transcription factor [Actinomycetospora sp. Odt1-22]